MRVTDFLHWQARWCANAQGHAVHHHRLRSMMRRDVNEEAIAGALDIVADTFITARRTITTDRFNLCRPTSRARSSTPISGHRDQRTDIGWTSGGQYPPYDGQMREDVYTYLADGANMVEYWHWASIHANQETYWKGILSHDLEPNASMRR